jgi:hypothetical protein
MINIKTNSKLVSCSMYLGRMSEPLLFDNVNGIYLGRSEIYKIPFLFDLDSLMNKNIAILGMSGSGKSYFLKSFIARSNMQRNSFILIVDWNNEYHRIVEFLGGKALRLGIEIKINLFDIYDLSNIKNVRIICDIISQLLNLNNEESYLVYNIVLSKNARRKNKTNLTKVIGELEEENDAVCSKIAKKLLQLKNNPMFADKTNFNFNALLNGVISIDFSMLRDDSQRNEISKSIFRIITELMHNLDLDKVAKDTERIIVLDEAWRLIKNSEDVGTLFREGRKYGFCVAIATQLVNDINNEVISNSACMFIFRLQNENDYNVLTDSGIINNVEKEKLANLSVGSCLVSLVLKTKENQISRFFLASVEGVITDTYGIKCGRMQNIISHRLFVESTKNLMVSEQAKDQIMNFIMENNNEIDGSRLVRFLLDLKVDRPEIVHYFRKLGIKDKEIIILYERAAIKEINK